MSATNSQVACAFFLIVALIANAWCALRNGFFLWVLAAQVIFYGLALAGILGGEKVSANIAVKIPKFFHPRQCLDSGGLGAVSPGRKIDNVEPICAVTGRVQAKKTV